MLYVQFSVFVDYSSTKLLKNKNKVHGGGLTALMQKQKNSRHLINHLVHSLQFEHVLTLFWLFCVIYIAKFHVTSFFLLFIVR